MLTTILYMSTHTRLLPKERGKGWCAGDIGGNPEGVESGIQKTSTLSAEQQKLMDALGPWLSERMGKGLPAYTGEMTAPISEGEQAAYDKALSNLGGGLSTSAQGSVDAYKKALTGLSEKEVYDQYMKYTAPAEARYLKETTIPTFKESMVPGGTLRSTGTERGIGDIISKYGEGQLGRIGERISSERANAVAALGQATNMNALETQAGDMSAAATYGGIARTIEQAELTAKLQEFIRTTPEMSPIVEMMLQYLGIGTEAAYYQQGKAPIWATIMSGAAPYTGMSEGVNSYYA